MKTKIALVATAAAAGSQAQANVKALSPTLVKAFGKITNKKITDDAIEHDHQGASVQMFYHHDGKMSCYINLPGLQFETPKPLPFKAFVKKLSTNVLKRVNAMSKEIHDMEKEQRTLFDAKNALMELSK
jgi:hypothetical protein